MKLATALSERSDLQRRISELGGRLNQNSKVMEGDAPAEDPAELLAELDRDMVRLEELIAHINITNNETVTPDGKRLTDLLAKRDCLTQRISILRSFLDSASARVKRYTKTEIKILSTVSVAELQKQVDSFSQELRQTEELIQELNWTTELI